jgi:hypothetical protein
VKESVKVSKRSRRAAEFRALVVAQLGGRCADCPETEHLQCDLIISDCGRHHSLSYPDRIMFYFGQMLRCNLALRCPRCHTRRTLAEVKARRAAALCGDATPMQRAGFGAAAQGN